MDILEKLKDRSLCLDEATLTEAADTIVSLRRDIQYYEYMTTARLAKLFAAKGDTPREILSDVHFRAQVLTRW